MKEVTTDQAPQASGVLSQAIVSNGFIFVAGQIHNDLTGELVAGTTTEKVDLIMKNISAVLSAAGASLKDVVKVTIYVSDMAILPDLNQVYPKFFSQPLPAREAVCVKALPRGADIEVSVIAEAA